METEVQEKTVKLSLRKGVFFPPWLLLVAMVVVRPYERRSLYGRT